MKSLSKWLVPGFLRRLDQYLRERYPVIWYSGAHWVLFYGLLGGIGLFGAGLLYPVHWVKRELVDKKYMNLDHWVVDPIRPIEFAYDELYIYSLCLVIAVACIWMYRQFQLRPFFYQVQYSLFCLLIYVGCWWVLFGVTATAFRMGTIVKTAWFWMPERDLQDFKSSGIYPYGFVSMPEDSLGIIPEDTLAFFQKREKAFKQIWKEDESWLRQRYQVDTLYWKKRLKESASRRLYLMDMSYMSYPSYPLNRSYLSDGQWSRSDLSDHQLDRYSADRTDSTDRADQSVGWYRAGRRDRYSADRTDSTDRADQLLKSIYYEVAKERIKLPKALVYQLHNYNDTLSTDPDPLMVIPSLPNQIEDAVRSVEHARQFLREGIFWRYFLHLPYYLLFFSVLLFLLSWVSARNLLQLLVFPILNSNLYRLIRVEDGTILNICVYLMLPLPGLLLLLWMLWQQKQGPLLRLAINMVFLGLLFTLVMTLFNDLRYPPTDAAFYGAQLIGLLAACIVPYVQAMPKTR